MFLPGDVRRGLKSLGAAQKRRVGVLCHDRRWHAVGIATVQSAAAFVRLMLFSRRSGGAGGAPPGRELVFRLIAAGVVVVVTCRCR
jgi:hypothetical protein